MSNLNELYERKAELEEELENYFDDNDDDLDYHDVGYQEILNELKDVNRQINKIMDGDDEDEFYDDEDDLD